MKMWKKLQKRQNKLLKIIEVRQKWGYIPLNIPLNIDTNIFRQNQWREAYQDLLNSIPENLNELEENTR